MRALVLALLVAIGCKGKDKADTDAVLREMKKFREEACACKDRECVSRVTERIAAWSQKSAKDANQPKPTSTQMKEISVVSEDLSKCITRVMSPTAPSVADAAPTDAAPAIDAPAAIDAAGTGRFPDEPSVVTVEALISNARTWARNQDDRLTITDVEVFFIDDTGVLDPDSGRVTIELGPTPTARSDDPNRRTGAPVKPPSAAPLQCAEVSWTPKGRWKYETRSRCLVATPPFPRCTVAEIWKRAIAKGAPTDAVAVLVLRETPKRTWSFKITDEIRGVNFTQFFPDDCELAVEKP